MIISLGDYFQSQLSLVTWCIPGTGGTVSIINIIGNAFSRHAHRWYSIDHVRLQGSWYISCEVHARGSGYVIRRVVILCATRSWCHPLKQLATCSWCYALNLLKQTFILSSFPRCLYHGIKTQEHPELQKLLYGYCWRQSLGPLTLEEFLKEIRKAVKACKCFWNNGKIEEMKCKQKVVFLFYKRLFF